MKNLPFLLFPLLFLNNFSIAQFTVYNNTNSGITENSIWDIECDSIGNVWIGSFYDGLYKTQASDYTSWTAYSTTNSQISDNQLCGLNADAGSIFAGTYASGFNYFDGVNWTNYNTSNSGLPNNVIYKIEDGPVGIKYIITKGGLSIYNGTVFTNFNSSNSGLSDDILYSVAYNKSNSDVWVAPYSSGIELFDGSGFTTNYNTANSPLPSNDVYYLYYDLFNNLWIGTYNGLAKYDGVNWTVYTTTNSTIPGSYIRQITMDPDSIRLYVATTTGFGILNTQTQVWQTYTTLNSNLPENNCFAVDVDNKGNVLVGTYGGGLAVLRNMNSIIEGIPLPENVSIYPNPTSDNVTIKANSNIDKYNLYNISGQLLQNASLNAVEFDLNLELFDSGIYLLTLYRDDKQVHRKIIKN